MIQASGPVAPRALRSEGLAPTAVTYGSLAAAPQAPQGWLEASELLRDAERHSVQGSWPFRNAVLKQLRWPQGLHSLATVEKPTTISYNTVMSNEDDWREAGRGDSDLEPRPGAYLRG